MNFNSFKTVIFLGLLTGILLGIGYLFGPYGLIIGFIFALLMNFVSYFYSDKIVLWMYKAKLAEKSKYPELHELVSDVAKLANIPKPKVYIVTSANPNAFATGRNAEHAAIAVTEGALQKLDKNELEGVLAHELSHIGNRDILLQSVIVVLAGLISIMADWFLRSMFWGGDDRDNKNGAIMLVGIIASILAPIAAMIIQLAISRKREFLADASGALLTRYPEGLASALEKISQDQHPMRRASSANAHLYISNPFRGKAKTSWFSKMFMTHPPIEERVAALRGLKI